MVVDFSKNIKELARINSIHETQMRIYCMKYNPMLAFIKSTSDDSVRRSIIHHYINDINSIKQFNDKFYCRWTRICRNEFMKYLFSIDKFRDKLKLLINKYTSWELAEILGITQHSVRILCEFVDLKIPNHNSSKIHMRMKPYIEKTLGFKTISEYFVKANDNRYFIDEYCDELKLCIEIDGSWCHSELRDKQKDFDLNSIGLKVIRIPTSIEFNCISEYIRSRL